MRAAVLVIAVPVVLFHAATAAAAPGRLPLEAVPERYAITLAPHLAAGTFDGEERVELRVPRATSTVTLDAADYVVTRARVGDDVAAIHQDAGAETLTLTFARALPAGSASLELAWHGKLSDKLSGFYHAESEGRRYAFTDFEPTDARRAFPSFDEPALKAHFQMTAIIDAGDVAVSNAPVVSEKVVGKQKTVRFGETPRLSTYLVALAVGPLVESHTMAGKTPIRVFTTPGKAALAGYALSYASELLPFYEKYFGVPYAYGKLDLVAVPDFEAGAMENAGAIFFRETALLADEHSSVDHQRNVAMVIAHEMAHQWFGDLVTMKWWDDLWLNEAFASWAENRAESALHPDWEPWLDFSRSFESALGTDALAATHPIRMPIATPDQAREAFDAITYSKGASVLRMLERWLGDETWRRGVGDYLRAHAEGNATGDDLWRALAAVSKEPVTDVARSWLDRGGHPLVTATARCRAGKSELVLTQTRDGDGGTNDPWLIPLCTRTPAGTRCALMKTAKETRVVAPTCQPWVEANAGLGGFYRVRYDGAGLRALGRAAEKSLEPIERVGLVGDEWALVKDGRAPQAEYLDLVSELGGEPRTDVVDELGRSLGRIGHELVSAADRAAWQGFMGGLFGAEAEALGWQARSGDTTEQRRLRAAVWEALGDAEVPSALDGAVRQLARYLADARSVDPSLVSTVIELAARSGDRARFDSYEARMKAATTPEDRDRWLVALADFEAPPLVERTLALALSPAVRTQDAARLVGASFSHPWSRRAAWHFVEARYGELAAKIPANMMTRLAGAVGSFCDPALLADAQRFWSDKKAPGLERRLRQASEDAQHCIDWKKREAAPLSAWLRAQKHEHAAR
jgi:aminopeptidase N